MPGRAEPGPERPGHKKAAGRGDCGSLMGLNRKKEGANLFHGSGQLGALFEFDGFAGCDFDGFFGAGVDAGALTFFYNGEGAEADEGNLVTFGKCFGDSGYSGVKCVLSFNFSEAGLFGDGGNEFVFVHN